MGFNSGLEGLKHTNFSNGNLRTPVIVVVTEPIVTKLTLDFHDSVHHDIITKMTNKMQMCRIIYCSLTSLHVSSDIFAHHQEHLNCIYSFWY
jgi:hypothetical protein